MALYLISGPDGSGKSTVGRILQQRGYRVIETDFEDGLSAWFDVSTGRKVTKMPGERYPEGWGDSHRWLWNGSRMEALIKSVGSKSVFFCGSAHNESEFYDAFQKRFGLWVNNKVLVERLQARDPERWANGSTELKRMLEWNEETRRRRQKGIIVVDSSSSPKAVVDSIVGQL
jgi:hypothetical protein